MEFTAASVGVVALVYNVAIKLQPYVCPRENAQLCATQWKETFAAYTYCCCISIRNPVAHHIPQPRDDELDLLNSVVTVDPSILSSPQSSPVEVPDLTEATPTILERMLSCAHVSNVAIVRSSVVFMVQLTATAETLGAVSKQVALLAVDACFESGVFQQDWIVKCCIDSDPNVVIDYLFKKLNTSTDKKSEADGHTDVSDLEKQYIAARYQGDTYAFAQLVTAADQGNHLAEAYLSIYFAQNKAAEKAVVYANRAIPGLQTEVTAGNMYAMYALGWLFSRGIGVTKDEQEAVRLYMLAAEQGHATAQFNLGVCYTVGTGTTKDETKAMHFYTLALEQGFAPAKFNFGVSYANDTGVTKDEQEAVRLLTLAANLGYAEAHWYLGYCYATGTGVTKDSSKAAEQWTLAAEHGLADAQFNLALAYQGGIGVAKNRAEAKRYLKLAADQGHAQAATELAKYWF